MSTEIRPFKLHVEQQALDDLALRLSLTRWPEKETVGDWSQGAPLQQVQALCDYWRTGYDWRRCEAVLNGFGLYKSEIDGVEIAFIHKRSPHAAAQPMIMTHGWPGSIIEFHKVIGPLTDPLAHGGRAEDAFHVVAPCLPGYGFSGKPTEKGWGVEKIAGAWCELMRRLGYTGYVAQGGDWGSAVTSAIGTSGAPEVQGIHVNMMVGFPSPDEMSSLTDSEKASLAALEHYSTWGNGYSQQQATRPQTLGYALADSPAGQAAWIFEKFHEWADCNGDPLSVFTRDELLDNIMLYWLTNSGASSARLYWESFRNFPTGTIDVPVGASIFPKEIFRASRRWAERRFTQLAHWGELDRGGHFAAFEQPELFVSEVRTAFRAIRALREA